MAVRDSSLGEIVGGKLHGDTVSCQHPNTVAAQLAGQVSEDGAVQVQLYAEQAAREFFYDGASDLDAIFFAHCPPRVGFSAIGILAKWVGGSRLWVVIGMPRITRLLVGVRDIKVEYKEYEEHRGDEETGRCSLYSVRSSVFPPTFMSHTHRKPLVA